MEPQNSILLATFFALTVPFVADAAPPNLCDDVYLDASGAPIHDREGVTFPRYCEFTGPEAPRWGAPVCCSFSEGEARCTALDSTGGCESDRAQLWCDHGERLTDGSVVCYRPLPSTCDYIDCVQAPAGATLADEIFPLCCWGGECYQLHFGDHCGGGNVTYCDAPYTNMNGSVGCADDE